MVQAMVLEINGQRYEHVSAEIMENLVECALIVLQRGRLSICRPGHCSSD